VKPWQLVLLLGGLAVAVWFVRRSRSGQSARTLLVVSIALVVSAVLTAWLWLLFAGLAVFVGSLAVSYVSARRV
jgi:hypothetical protein